MIGLGSPEIKVCRLLTIGYRTTTNTATPSTTMLPYHAQNEVCIADLEELDSRDEIGNEPTGGSRHPFS